MPTLRLGKTPFRALDGMVYEESISIKIETPKAILLQIEKRGKVKEHWIPKSVSHIRERPKIKVVDGKPIEAGKISEIHIDDWFWKKEIEGATW